MKTVLRLLSLAGLLISPLFAQYVPTPRMAMSWDQSRDPVSWEPQSMDGNRTGIIVEMVPAGQSIMAWREMLAQQIAFTRTPLHRYVDHWKGGMRQADPAIELEEERLEDGSVLIAYTSRSADEASVRRFIKARDGIYMLAYHVRPDARDEDRWALWRDIATRANLVPNPERAR